MALATHTTNFTLETGSQHSVDTKIEIPSVTVAGNITESQVGDALRTLDAFLSDMKNPDVLNPQILTHFGTNAQFDGTVTTTTGLVNPSKTQPGEPNIMLNYMEVFRSKDGEPNSIQDIKVSDLKLTRVGDVTQLNGRYTFVKASGPIEGGFAFNLFDDKFQLFSSKLSVNTIDVSKPHTY